MVRLSFHPSSRTILFLMSRGRQLSRSAVMIAEKTGQLSLISDSDP